MDRRLELHEHLCQILGSRHVYYQPDASLRLVYPAIVYFLNSVEQIPADNRSYLRYRQYTVQLIDPNPDSTLVERIMDQLRARFVRSFVSDALNHFEFRISY